ncbi:MAG: hypothetical protein AAGL68_08840 [Pseudomonadota bacterium]
MTGAVAACGGGPRGPSNDVIQRVLTGAPGEAQPSRIVATEIAFARAAREEGQWTAFEEFAAPGGLIHGRNGPVDAIAFASALKDPAEAVQWGTRAIWMSCDGGMAVSQGRFRDPQGIIGTYITVWERGADGQYRYTYDVGSHDDPQPPPREAPREGEIVVTAMDSVRADIADCARRGETVPAPPPVIIGEGYSEGVKLSRDGTLRWRWLHYDDGRRRVVADYLSNGSWQVALDEFMPVTPGSRE